jgi:hypothetical protein
MLSLADHTIPTNARDACGDGSAEAHRGIAKFGSADVKWAIRLENAATVGFCLKPAFRRVRIVVQGTELGAPEKRARRGKSE